MHKSLDGSYTVEATAIVGLSITIIFLMIILGFQVYHDALRDISEYEVVEDDPAKTFRWISLGKDIWEEVKE
ncbi:MAG: hypothetical protein K6F30_05635 [Lachnospiraceae bacterium]|nr:hypothetical protein [Lachnospiraceae bacterium]